MKEAQEFQVRGYMFLTAVKYLQAASDRDSAALLAELSAQAREHLITLKSADWCPVEVFSEVTEAIAKMGGTDERARDLLVHCGAEVAKEATNTFLRLFMKLMSPQLLAKKVPDLWRRDCTGGKLVLESLDGDSLCFATSGMHGCSHAVCTAAGFVSFALGAIGKNVEGVELSGWSIEDPCSDGAAFTLRWSNC